MNLSFVKKILLAKTEGSEAVDKEPIHELIDSIIEILQEDGPENLDPLERSMLKNSLHLVSRLKQNGASAKQVLEYIALACKQR